MPEAETKRYQVSMANGSNPAIVEVPFRTPFSKRIRRQVEKLRELPDGRKRLDYEWEEFDHEYDVESEMRDDAVRKYNEGSGKAYSARQLLIEAVPVAQSEQPDRAPSRGFSKKTPVAVPAISSEP